LSPGYLDGIDLDLGGDVQRAQGRSLLALDVDGTLLTSNGALTTRTRDALHAADRAGWYVVVVTGRPIQYAWPVVHELGVGEYVVAANGATVGEVASGAILYQASLPGRDVLVAVAAARAVVEDLRLAITTPDGVRVEGGYDRIAPLSKRDAVVVGDASPRPDDTVHSALLFVVGADATTLVNRVAPVLPPEVHVAPSGLPGSVELTAPGVNKGSGLAHLCERLGIERGQVVAFGDGLNDHELLVWAGRGVAMGNAAAETKALADEVTTSSDDDGVAVVVERLLSVAR